MATVAISALPSATAAATTDVLPIVQGGTTKQVTNALLFTNSTLVTPVLGTPASGTLTNCTGLPVATGISGLASGIATFLATGTSLTATGAIVSTGTAGVGYATGAGGSIVQSTSRTTSVTLNKTAGAITLFSAAGTTTATTFTVLNSTVAATDVIILSQKSGTDLYDLMVTAVAAGSFNITFRTTGGTSTETPIFNFAVIKAVIV
jgi:histidine ammonia-lyase